MGGLVEPKIWGWKTPPNHPFVHRVWNHYFHHPFWVYCTPYFWFNTRVVSRLATSGKGSWNFQSPSRDKDHSGACLKRWAFPVEKLENGRGTVDGSEIYWKSSLGWYSLSTIIFLVFFSAPSQVVVWDFRHQQYHDFFVTLNRITHVLGNRNI